MVTKKRFWILGLTGLTVLGSALGGYWQFRASGVELIPVRRGDLVEAIYGIGTVTPRREFHFRVGQVRSVERIFVQEGQVVQTGQPLLELNDGVKVRSPIEGTVTSLPFNVGENVFQDAPIVEVQDIKDRYVRATLEQQGALRVRRGLSVRLNFESFRDKNFIGVVESVYPQNGQFLVRIEVKELPPEILPGMTADASIEAARKQNVLLVPVLAINNGKLLREREGQRAKVDVQIGSMDGEWAEVLSGDVREADLVVLKR